MLCALTSSALWLTACGGRFRTVDFVEDDDIDLSAGTANGGSAGKAAPSKGGSPSRGGTTGVAGAPSAGGKASSCEDVPCPPPACGPGQMPVKLAGQCCFSCQDDPGACMKGQALYQQERAAYAEKASYGCASSMECGIVTLSNGCEQCGYAAVWYGTAEYFKSSADFAAEQYCGACMPGPLPPCAFPGNAVCVQGRCMMPFLN